MANTDGSAAAVAAHYAHQALEPTLLAALAQAGIDLDQLRIEDLAPIDEFHIGGRRATLEFARQLELQASMQVLDVGSGLGGPSRTLAAEFGCRVTGLDLSSDYCRVAALLARRLGLDGRVDYRCGNALAMPFEDARFDLLWTQHAAMNIADKHGLYAEMRRVLKPGGILAIYDVLAGEGGAVHFPVPWAREPAISCLVTPQQLRATLEETGFEIVSWQDVTERGRSWFRRMAENLGRNGLPRLGIHLLLGADFQEMAQNQVRNLEEGRIVLAEVVARRR